MRKLPLVLCAGLLPLGVAADCDTDEGRVVFQKCEACHTVAAHASGSEGPSLLTVFGREAGTLEGFHFSPAMRRSGIVWTRASLDRYLRDPAVAVPGNRMPFYGLSDDAERNAVICYLASLGDSEESTEAE